MGLRPRNTGLCVFDFDFWHRVSESPGSTSLYNWDYPWPPDLPASSPSPPLPFLGYTSDYNMVLKLWKGYPAVLRILSFPTIPKDHTFPYFLFCWELWTSLFTVAKGPFPHSKDSWASGPLNRKALPCLSKLSRVRRSGEYTRVSGQWDASG